MLVSKHQMLPQRLALPVSKPPRHESQRPPPELLILGHPAHTRRAGETRARWRGGASFSGCRAGAVEMQHRHHQLFLRHIDSHVDSRHPTPPRGGLRPALCHSSSLKGGSADRAGSASIDAARRILLSDDLVRSREARADAPRFAFFFNVRNRYTREGFEPSVPVHLCFALTSPEVAGFSGGIYYQLSRDDVRIGSPTAVAISKAVYQGSIA
jgi:hypothetical protein